MRPMIPERSILSPHMSNRILKVIILPRPADIDIGKEAEESISIPPDPTFETTLKLLIATGLAYTAFRKLVPKAILPKVHEFFDKHPLKAAILTGIGVGAAAGLNSVDELNPPIPKMGVDNFNEIGYHKVASSKLLKSGLKYIGIPAGLYTYAGHLRNKRLRGQRLNTLERFAARHPGGLTLAAWLSPLILKR
jgi:hypothetical protein